MSKNTQSPKTPTKASKKKKPSLYTTNKVVQDDNLLVGVYAWTDLGENEDQPPRTRLGIVVDLEQEQNLRRFDALGHLWPVGTASVVFKGSRDMDTAVAGFIKVSVGEAQPTWEEATALEALAEVVRKSVFSEMRRNAVRNARGVSPSKSSTSSANLREEQIQGLVALKKSLSVASVKEAQSAETSPADVAVQAIESAEQPSV